MLFLAGADDLLRVRAAAGIDPESLSDFAEPMRETAVDAVRAAIGAVDSGGSAALPVMVDRSVSGLLAVARDEPFGAEEHWLLSALADQAAIALRNAKLHEMEIERRRAEALERLAQESVRLLTSMAEGRTYDELLGIVCRITDAPRGIFWLVDEGANGEEFLRAASTLGYRRVPRDDFDRRTMAPLRHLRLDADLPVTRAGRSLTLVSVPDLYEDPTVGTNEAVRRMGIRSLLAVPVRARGRLLGVVSLVWHEAGMSERPGVQHNAEVIVNLVSAALDVSVLVTELTQANRLKDEFLATLSHELRNPLNVIAGYSELLLRIPEARSSPKIRDAAAAIARSVTAQDQLVSDLLDLSRLQMGKLSLQLQPLSLSAAAADAVDAVRSQANARRIEITIEPAEEPLICRADATRVQQIVWNLLSNAVKFTPAGGSVRLKLSRIGSEASLVVEDTGEGIDPGFLPRVFDVFRQAEGGTVRRHGGMGIGLALVRQLTELHGGSVEAHSEGPGQGARFTVRLPLHEAASVPGGAEPERSSAPLLSGLRLLVVDDSPETVASLRDLLESEGAEVSIALSGREALRIAADARFHFVISDISMPEMDGYQLLTNLRNSERGPSVAAIALTGFGRDEDVLQARQAGFDEHLTKPVRFSDLLEMLRSAMSARAGSRRRARS